MTELYGMILAGGNSSRMGTDKSVINYHGIGQREFLHMLLQEFCNQVFVSCKAGQVVPKSLNPLHDQLDLQSPLNGILSAFRFAPGKAWLFVAVDMPLVDHEVIHHLIKQRDPTKVTTCFLDSKGNLPEPLLSIWEPSAAPLLESYIAEGGFSPREFLMKYSIKTIVINDVSKLTNINTRQDLLNFRIQHQNLHKK